MVVVCVWGGGGVGGDGEEVQAVITCSMCCLSLFDVVIKIYKYVFIKRSTCQL